MSSDPAWKQVVMQRRTEDTDTDTLSRWHSQTDRQLRNTASYMEGRTETISHADAGPKTFPFKKTATNDVTRDVYFCGTVGRSSLGKSLNCIVKAGGRASRYWLGRGTRWHETGIIMAPDGATLTRCASDTRVLSTWRHPSLTRWRNVMVCRSDRAWEWLGRVPGKLAGEKIHRQQYSSISSCSSRYRRLSVDTT